MSWGGIYRDTSTRDRTVVLTQFSAVSLQSSIFCKLADLPNYMVKESFPLSNTTTTFADDILNGLHKRKKKYKNVIVH